MCLFFLLPQVFKGMSFGDLQTFITEQENLSIRAEPEKEGSPILREFKGYLDDNLMGKQILNHGKKLPFRLSLMFSSWLLFVSETTIITLSHTQREQKFRLIKHRTVFKSANY